MRCNYDGLIGRLATLVEDNWEPYPIVGWMLDSEKPAPPAGLGLAASVAVMVCIVKDGRLRFYSEDSVLISQAVLMPTPVTLPETVRVVDDDGRLP